MSPPLVRVDDDKDWDLEDAIEFCAGFETKDDMVANKPDVTDGLWSDILKVFDLIQVYGTDPDVIDDAASALDAKNGETKGKDVVAANHGEKPAPSDNPLNPKTSNEGKKQSPPMDEQPMKTKEDGDAPSVQNFRMDPGDGVMFLKSCGFDDATAESCIAAAGSDIAYAIRMAKLSHVPDPKPEEKQTVVVDSDCLPPQDSQYPDAFEEMTVDEYKSTFPENPSMEVKHIDAVETIPIDDDDIIPPLLDDHMGTQEDMESELEGDEPMGAKKDDNNLDVDKSNMETMDTTDKTADSHCSEALAVGMGGPTYHLNAMVMYT